ncbi:MAG: hypothetical protein ABI573_08235 [Chloroflexota bacterium]
MLATGVATTALAAGPCIATGAVDRDGTALTARLMNPSGVVKGKVDATGCSVGVYYSTGKGTVRNADIFGATYYGVLVDGNGHAVAADIVNSTVHDIGDLPLTSDRHGQGIAYRGFGGTATGSAIGNRVWHFQEAGINETGPGATVAVVANRVTGRGPEDVISQNGIQVLFGAHGNVVGNVISDLSFVGTWATGNGVLVAGGPSYDQPYTVGTRIVGNVISNTDVGIVVFELNPDWTPPEMGTDTWIVGNLVRNDVLQNVGGWDGDLGVGYQAGISIDGHADHVIGNTIIGRGYDQAFCGDAAVCLPIDTDVDLDPIVRGNRIR